MAYRPPNHHAFASLRNRRALETAMKNRDLSGRELSVAVKTSPQNMSKLRRGISHHCHVDLARRIERALRVEPGTLFEYDPADAAAAVSA
jgi:DNA-binding Xre family transcriptional regulator